MKLDTKITRLFTKNLENTTKTVYDLFEWKKVNVILKNYKTGAIITDMQELEFPKEYSQSACDIIASKYFRKKGVNLEKDYEYSLKQVANRLVTFWTNSMVDSGLINKEQQIILYDELVFIFLAQMWAPNSPQWFNTGLKIYGITGTASGHYYYDETTQEVVASNDSYTKTQGSACFITTVKDTLVGEKSLTDQLTTETLLFKYGSGVGSNWSSIRAKGETLSGGGTSSGLLSFLKVSDRNAGAIKSGGTTRRAAKMNILDIDHPEILDYIEWKSKEEDKVVALSKMGYSTDIDGEAYETVSGQNANNSVRIPNSFMDALDKENATFVAKGRVDQNVNKELSVNHVWEKIAYAAWRCGDPGIQYDDIINAWHTCPRGVDGELGAKHNRINASNPCSEYMFLDDTACNLASINLLKFYNTDSFEFLLDEYLHCIFLAQLVLESTIHFGQFPTKDIAKNSYLFRTTGLGYTNLGTLLMVMGLPYDSEDARALASSLASIMTGHSYYSSALMAEKIGPFKAYNTNKEHMLKVIKNHAIVAGYDNKDTTLQDISYEPVHINHDILKNLSLKKISTTLQTTWKNTIEQGKKHGFRNAQVTVLAPTGTIAFAMDCSSTSSEPFFSHIAYKKLVGGGFMEMINPAIEIALTKLGYKDDQIKDILDYVMQKENGTILDGKIEGAPHLDPNHYAVFDTANKCGSGTRFIAPEGHVKMMGAITPHITGAISKTVNLPKEATVDDVKNIYKLSYDYGIKAIALYRDDCKSTQPLNSTNTEKNKALDELSYNELLTLAKSANVSSLHRAKPQGIRTARVHEAVINGLKLYVTTAFYENGKLAEVYVSCGKQGSLTKGLLDSISSTISKMLQYGLPAEDIARMYRGQKFEPSGFITGHPYIKSIDSISDLISKIIDIELGDYTYCQIKPNHWQENKQTKQLDLTKFSAKDYIYGEVCPTCKSAKMVKNGVCKVCIECGSTTGCS